jgi:hypothetical protein
MANEGGNLGRDIRKRLLFRLRVAIAATVLFGAACGTSDRVSGGARSSPQPTSPGLASGFTLVVMPASPVDSSVLTSSAMILGRRLRAAGLPYAVSQIGNSIRMTVASSAGSDQLLLHQARTGQLLFRPVLCTDGPFPPYIPSAAVSDQATRYTGQECPSANSQAGSRLPTTTAAQDVPNATVLLPTADKNSNPDTNGPRYLLGPAQLTGQVVAGATATPPDPTQNQPNWFVQIQFTSSGSAEFDKLAQNNYQKQVGIVVDHLVVSTPTVNTMNFGGTAVISGNFGEGAAKDLALLLTTGSLPVEFMARAPESYVRAAGSNLRGLAAGATGIEVTLPAASGTPQLVPATLSERIGKAGFDTYQILTTHAETIIDVVGPNTDAQAVLAALNLGSTSQRNAASFTVAMAS